MHPRNRHQGRYDLAALAEACPALKAHIGPNPHQAGQLTVDFTNPRAVKVLNQALLQLHYGVQGWTIPEGYLCPPIPGRADLIHAVADLLAEDGRNCPGARVLDIGTGANGVYPLLGHAEYGWRTVGTDIDAVALASLQRVLEANPTFRDAIELRQQAQPQSIFRGVWQAGESFDATICNPPFHASADDAAAGSARKWRQLGHAASGVKKLNFGGNANELWCPGGERNFVLRMIRESVHYADRCRWFSTLLSKEANLKPVLAELRHLVGVELRVIDMTQGQKKSRLVAWRFSGRV